MPSFTNKKIAILGLSVEGTDAAKFLKSQNAEIHCCDRRFKAQLGIEYQVLANLGVIFHLGTDYLKNLEQYDLLIRTPGMALSLPELTRAAKLGLTISSLTKLFFDVCPCPIIGVTGTKGKGTTTTLIGSILKVAGYNAYIGGNVGVPLLSQVEKIKPSDWVVLELSSFQLEDLHKSPHISVILNITSDHLANADELASNFHRSREDYVNAKRQIVRSQTSKDWTIVNNDYETPKKFSQLAPSRKLFFSIKQVVNGAYVQNNTLYRKIENKIELVGDTKDLLLRGQHNWENVTAAIATASAVGISLPAIQKAVFSFKGLEHRLELVGTFNKVTFYNDSFSTTPETAIAAIKSFNEPIILIAGGSEKGSDYTKLGQAISESSVRVVILIGEMADKIEVSIKKANRKLPEIVKGLTSMEAIVATAKKLSLPGDVVLLSPACASFGLFKNYKLRGSLFKKYVQKAN